MTTVATAIPSRRPDLIVRPIGEDGRYVVKIPGTTNYFHLGVQEEYLLRHLDGHSDPGRICRDFETEFGEPLSPKEVDEFIEMASGMGLLQDDVSDLIPASATGDSNEVPLLKAPPQPKLKQSILYWRKSLFDPDRFFNWLEPKIRVFWTRGFFSSPRCASS